MNIDNNLKDLLHAYKNAPKEFQATTYWQAYEKLLLDTVASIDLNQLRSGKYPVLATFGFNDVKYFYHVNLPFWKKAILKFFHNFVVKDRPVFPYNIKTHDIQEVAYRHCELMAQLTKAVPISDIEVSAFGSPKDIFEVNGRKYTMSFLNYYLRYCFCQKHIPLKGDEVIVELGSGSGYQVEVLKKAYPNLTVLCFDLPAQIYLCEKYLSQAIGAAHVIGTNVTLKWKDLSGIIKGGVHFLGNWQFSLLRDYPMDVFWNAASFGEMEPDIVKNYLGFIKGTAKWIYLLQARHGKEKSGKNHVVDPITLETYKKLLSGYTLKEEQTAWQAHMKLSQSGGYFEGVWAKEW